MKYSGSDGATDDGVNEGAGDIDELGARVGVLEGYMVGLYKEYEVTLTVPPQLFEE